MTRASTARWARAAAVRKETAATYWHTEPGVRADEPREQQQSARTPEPQRGQLAPDGSGGRGASNAPTSGAGRAAAGAREARAARCVFQSEARVHDSPQRDADRLASARRSTATAAGGPTSLTARTSGTSSYSAARGCPTLGETSLPHTTGPC